MYGLLKRDLDHIIHALESFPDIEKAVLFGSRAMGNYKKGSDIDIAIYGMKIKYETVSRLSGSLNEEFPIPYFIDVVKMDSIKNVKLIEHIEKQGVVIYQKRISGETST